MRKRKMCWRNLWKVLFLAVSILSSCFLLIEGQVIITQLQIKVQPEHPKEGQIFTLIPKGNWSAARVCRWYRGQAVDPEIQILTYFFPQKSGTSPGPAFTNRETTGRGCFLRIINSTARDTGNYTLIVDGIGLISVAYGFVVVSEYLSSPLLETSPINGIVAEYSDAILTCHTSNQPDVSVFWLKNGKLLPTTVGELSDWNRTLTFPHVAKSETGTYKCMANNSISYNESNPVQILVTYGPFIKIDPEGTVLKSYDSELFIECLVDSFPKAKLQWFLNGIEQNETGNVLNVRIRDQNSTGSYTCQATNPLTNYTDERTCYVILSDGHLSAAAIVGLVLGSVFGVAIIADLLYFLFNTSFRDRVQPPTSSGEVEGPTQAD